MTVQRMFAPVRIAIITAVATFAVAATAGGVRNAYAGGFGGGSNPFSKAKNPFGGSSKKKKYQQPPVTAGGLYTKETYPLEEVKRPLTITKGLLEVRADLNADLSSGNAFNIWRGQVRARYGIKDNFELQAGLNALLGGTVTPADTEQEQDNARLDLGFESAIVYNLVDFRLAAEMPVAPNFQFNIAAGVPVRYEPTPKIAIVAFDKLLTVYTDGTDPDLSIDLGGIYQALPKLALFVRAALTLPGFKSAGMAIPVSAAVQFTPMNTVDLGLQLTLANLKPASSSNAGPLDARLALLFCRLRI